MNILQKISQDLMSPNEMLTSILIIPAAIIEVILYVNIIISLLHISVQKRKFYVQMLILSIIGIISKFLIPTPYGAIINIASVLLSFIILYKTKFIETFIGLILVVLITALFEMISSQVFTLLFNRPYSEFANYPIYSIIFMTIVYSSLFIMLKLFKKFNINITSFKNINKKDSITILVTVALGFITVFLQLYISAFYNNLLPTFVILLSILCLIAYFFISLFSIVKTKQLEIATIDNQNLQSYNDNLKSMYDNIRAFKHDFNNIVHAIGGYVRAKEEQKIWMD